MDRHWDESPEPVRCVGDIDGDGAADVSVPSQLVDEHDRGSLRILSSATLEQVVRIELAASRQSPNDGFGHCARAAGDFDGDGRGDILVAYMDSCVRVHSGVTGATLRMFRELFPGGYFEGFGASMAALGDLNGDRVPEVAVGCAEFLDSADHYYAAVFDGRSGAPLRKVVQSDVPGRYHHVSCIGDVDGDGGADLAVALWEDGVVYLVSGRTLQVVRTLRRPELAR